MKTMLILLNILLLVIPITAPALKKINCARLFTMIMLLLYTIGMVKLVVLFPIPSLSLLGLGMLIILSIAFRFRHNPAGTERKADDHKTRMLNWHPGIRIKGKGVSFRKEWMIS